MDFTAASPRAVRAMLASVALDLFYLLGGELKAHVEAIAAGEPPDAAVFGRGADAIAATLDGYHDGDNQQLADLGSLATAIVSADAEQCRRLVATARRSFASHRRWRIAHARGYVYDPAVVEAECERAAARRYAAMWRAIRR